MEIEPVSEELLKPSPALGASPERILEISSKEDLVAVAKGMQAKITELQNKLFGLELDYKPSKKLQRQITELERVNKAFESRFMQEGDDKFEILMLVRQNAALLDKLRGNDPIQFEDTHVEYFMRLTRETSIRNHALEKEVKRLRSLNETLMQFAPPEEHKKRVRVERVTLVTAPRMNYPSYGNIKRLVGVTFGHLKVVKAEFGSKIGSIYTCECVCGKIVHVSGYQLKASKRSCGCCTWRGPTVQEMRSEYYPSWEVAALNEVKMYPPWRFRVESFLAWCKENVGERPSKEYVLSLIDARGAWEPGNVSWAHRDHANLGLEACLTPPRRIVNNGYYEDLVE
jgi:hypothetical protein